MLGPLLAATLACAPASAASAVDSSTSPAIITSAAIIHSTASVASIPFPRRRDRAMAALRAWFMDDTDKADEPEVSFSTAEESAHVAEVAVLRSLREEINFLRKGRCAEDSRQAYSDMAVALARELGIDPPEAAIPVYRWRARPMEDTLSPAEKIVRDELALEARSSAARRRHLFIAGLIGAPDPILPALKPRIIYMRNKRGRRIKRVIPPPELPPPPKPVSLISRIDWEKADELAEVADGNAHGWDRKPRESLRRYRRRLRRLRAHCYEWVRHDLEALGIWDAQLFRGYVPPTRRDRKRPIRAASFALAMSKVEASNALAARTNLRELNLRVDPLVRGAIVVFSPNVCSYSRRDGHIEIITSVDPLQAASFKFHPVKMECLIQAANQNKVHVYVPLRVASLSSPAGSSSGR